MYLTSVVAANWFKSLDACSSGNALECICSKTSECSRNATENCVQSFQTTGDWEAIRMRVKLDAFLDCVGPNVLGSLGADCVVDLVPGTGFPCQI